MQNNCKRDCKIFLIYLTAILFLYGICFGVMFILYPNFSRWMIAYIAMLLTSVILLGILIIIKLIRLVGSCYYNPCWCEDEVV